MKLKRETDLILLHPPSVYDFRERLIIPSPIADLIPSGPFFEMFPVGFSYLGEYLERHGLRVRVVNLAARMMEEPSFDVEGFIRRQNPRAFGIGLHWLPHCHGAVEVARLCKRWHPETPVIMGGYSASLFDGELLAYPEVDFVIRGDSGEEPLLRLMSALGGGDLGGIPNLTYRDASSGCVVRNPLSYVPADLEHLGGNYAFMVRSAARYADPRGVRAFKGWWSYPMTAVLTCRGCTNDCSFCGGSSWTMSRCMGRSGLAVRPPASVAADIRTICSFTGAPVFVIGDIRQPGDGYAEELLARLAGLSPPNHIVLELFEPAPARFFELAGSSLPHYDLEISPESHDESVRRAAGKGYGNDALEETIELALRNGCGKFDVFFMIGLEGQSPASVMQTVGYCSDLLARHGNRVNPLIGPMAPFLDPGSINQARADEHGYIPLLRTLEEHRRALLEPHWRDLLGYETRWMNRQQIVDCTYDALLELNRVKASCGLLSKEFASGMESFLLDNRALLDRLDAAMRMSDLRERGKELAAIKPQADELLERSAFIKESIRWPVEGARFRYGGLARMALTRGRAA